MNTKFTYEINPNGTVTIYQIITFAGRKQKIKCQTCNNESEAKSCINYMEQRRR